MDQNKVKLNMGKCKALLEVNKIRSAGTDWLRVISCEGLEYTVSAFVEWLLEKPVLVCTTGSAWSTMTVAVLPSRF